MSQLLEDSADKLDTINDHLTEMTMNEVSGKESIENMMNSVNQLLNRYAMMIDFDDVETMFEDWEEPSEDEAVNVVIPVYGDDNSETEYNLSVTYAYGDIATESYIVDIELQYEWEMEYEIDTEYVDIDPSDFAQG